MVQKGKHYYYKNHEYEVIDFVKTKVDGEWKDFVSYKQVSSRKLSNTEQVTFSRGCEDFDEKFIPTTLGEGIKVIGKNMGKIIGIYTFLDFLPTVSDNITAVRYKSEDGKQLTLYPNVNQDGSLVKIYDEKGIEGTEFYVLSNKNEKQLYKKEVENRIASQLTELSKMITDGNLNFSIERLLDIDYSLKLMLSKDK